MSETNTTQVTESVDEAQQNNTKPAEAEQYENGQVLSINYTPAGPISVIWQDGEQVVVKPYVETNFEIPGLTSSLLGVFRIFCFVYEQLIEANESRKIPLLMSEVTSVIPKPSLKKLHRKGLIDIQTLQMTNDKNQKESRAFCWPTNEGYGVRQAIREKTEEQKAATTSAPNPMAEEVKEVLDTIQV